jgi:hypothetical protein
MRRLIAGLAAVAAVAVGATAIGTRAEAGPLPAFGGLSAASDAVAITENVQYFFGGRNYCWYDDGWQGPGWYWCGYRWRRGLGWGGGHGFHGWNRGGHHGGHHGGPMGFGGGGGGPMGGGGGGGPMGFGGGGGPMGGGGGGGPMGFGGGGGPMGGGGGGGPMGGGGGGGMGGGMGGVGAPSDIHVKHDVVLLGRLDNGLGYYRFAYNGSDKAYVGVMAQEVEKVMPSAVVRGSDGYLRVFYDKLGLQMQSYDDWVAAGQKLPATATSIRQ